MSTENEIKKKIGFPQLKKKIGFLIIIVFLMHILKIF
jgi:hypothetical protein